MHEYEVKFLNINPTTIQRKLKTIGAKKVGHYFYKRRVFDYPDWRLDKNYSWLRLRDEGERITLTFKKRLKVRSHKGHKNDGGMQEIEILVNDFNKTADLLLSLGFVEKHYAENKRIRWRKNDVEFDIDTYPKLKPYLEIESQSWAKVNQAIKWLGLNPRDKKIFSANQVYAQNGINVSEYSKLAFKGLVKRKIKK